jgi:hypothetical protein
MEVDACYVLKGPAGVVQIPVQPLRHDLESGEQKESAPRHRAFVYRILDSVSATMSSTMGYLQRASSPRESFSHRSSITSGASFNTAYDELSTSKEGAATREAAGVGEIAAKFPNASHNGGKAWSQLPTGVCAPMPRDDINKAHAPSEVRDTQSVNEAPPTITPRVSSPQRVRASAVVMPKNNGLKEYIRKRRWVLFGSLAYVGFVCIAFIATPVGFGTSVAIGVGIGVGGVAVICFGVCCLCLGVYWRGKG